MREQGTFGFAEEAVAYRDINAMFTARSIVEQDSARDSIFPGSSVFCGSMFGGNTQCLLAQPTPLSW